MKVTEFLLNEMNREIDQSRRALQEVPGEGATGSRPKSR